jgi:hypothetical protein
MHAGVTDVIVLSHFGSEHADNQSDANGDGVVLRRAMFNALVLMMSPSMLPVCRMLTRDGSFAADSRVSDLWCNARSETTTREKATRGQSCWNGVRIDSIVN